MSPQGTFDPQILSKTIISVVQAVLQQKSSITFTSDPTFVKKDIIEYESRMRVFGMEIFNGPCYISVMNYYLSEQNAKDHNSCGTFIFYIEELNAGKILKALGYRGFDEDDVENMLENCGKLGKVIAESFAQEIAKQGYVDMIVGEPKGYHNSVPDGVEFNYEQYTKFESSYFFWKEKLVAVDITLEQLPEKK